MSVVSFTIEPTDILSKALELNLDLLELARIGLRTLQKKRLERLKSSRV